VRSYTDSALVVFVSFMALATLVVAGPLEDDEMVS
jgi:hypothetical protein